MSTHANRVKMTVTSVASSGTGDITLNAASTGFRSFATAYGANATVDILITEGTAWEIARNCTYTHSGTTVSRGTLESSSTDSAVAFTSAAVVSVIATAQLGNNTENVLKTYIRGLLVTKYASGNTIDVSAGACYDPSSDKVITYAGATNISVGTLGASQWNQVYIYDNAGTATIEVKNNEAPPSATYAGTARQGGTNSNRRWIGAFLTNGSSNIIEFQASEAANAVIVTTASIRAVSAGALTAFGGSPISLASIAPSYVTQAILCNPLVTAVSGGSDLFLSVDGTNTLVTIQVPGGTGATGYGGSIFWCPVTQSSGVPGLYYKITTAANVVYLDFGGYEARR